MKKYFLILLLALCLVSPMYVYAENTDEDKYTCKSGGFFGDPVNPHKNDDGEMVYDSAYYLQKAFVVMKYAGIVLCIVLTVADFAQCILKEDKDGFKPALNKGIKRLIFAIALFFLPSIVNAIMTLFGFYGEATCGIG